MPGMPVMTPDGASLGEIREVVANGRGEVQQLVVQQGNVTRTLPAGMFSASGNAVIAGEAQGNANAGSPKPAPADGSAAE
jgi:sporulation protein YlmC with PRC-barrel domain